MTTWELIEAGQLEEACKVADEEFAGTGSVLSLRNKVIALLCLDRFEEAINTSSVVIDVRKGETDSDFLFCGTAHWFLGRHEQAISCWENSRNTKYTDAAGGVDTEVVLYFAAVALGIAQLKLEAEKKMKRLWKKQNSPWPGPLAGYLTANLTADQLFARVSPVPGPRERQSCQANFSMAVVNLEDSKEAAYINRLEECVNLAPAALLTHEYHLARGELRKIKEHG